MLPRPRNFHPPGPILAASLARSVPPFLLARRRSTGARAEGRRYERRIREAFCSELGSRYLPNPWLRYHTPEGPRYCQPDGLLFDLPNLTCVVTEMKLAHCDLSWWQLYHLYIPVLERAFPLIRFIGVEVVKWYDAAIRTSGPVVLCKTIEAPLAFGEAQYPTHFVHIKRS